jgi:4-hydroxybenzoate polyprenyltransferase
MKKFFALSRTTHGVLDLAGPGFAAVIWLGQIPNWKTTLLGLATGFAAYTAVYALNDLMGIAGDREKFSRGTIKDGYAVEASALRYPLAQDALSPAAGLAWFLICFALALLGSWLLNPTIILVLTSAALLEVLYCLLHKVTYWRVIVSGLVKSGGPMAAVLMVDPSPELLRLLPLFGWVFLWEVGGQNVPADWNDTAEDRRLDAKTIPLQLGFRTAGLVSLTALSLSVLISLILSQISPADLGWLYWSGALTAGFFLLLRPAWRLYQDHDDGRLAARLFDRASWYPLAMLAAAAFIILFQS